MSGRPFEDCIPRDENSHTIGTVVFAPDGSLFVSSGDGSNYGGVDPRALRAQHLDSLAGKILRIDPSRGLGLPDNPFFDAGEPEPQPLEGVGLGLRNPFRISVHPGPSEAFIGDVGWNSWEEINTGRARTSAGRATRAARSRGRQRGLQRRQAGRWAAIETTAHVRVVLRRLPGENPFNPSQALGAGQGADFAYDHSAGGASANAGAFYVGTTYPPQYRVPSSSPTTTGAGSAS